MPTGEKNSLDYRRKQSIESNKRRWANGCPESTREKMSRSKKEYFQKMREDKKNNAKKIF